MIGYIEGMRTIDMTGQVFGGWTVLRKASPEEIGERTKEATYWWCRCRCGIEKPVQRGALMVAKSTMCLECWQKEVLRRSVDIAGARYGQLEVLGRVAGSHAPTLWACKCACGKRVELTRGLLTAGRKSCGCLTAAKDLTGKRRGKLVVVRRAERPPESKYGGTHWLCRCDCGAEVIRAHGRLRGNRALKSCGCFKAHWANLIARKFGRLEVVAKVACPERVKEKRPHWLCLCECGNIVTVLGKSLLRGDTKSCGCLQAETWGSQGCGPASKRKHDIWKREVHKNANCKCVVCGAEKGIVCHHIESRDHRPDLRHEVSNGTVFCWTHHVAFHMSHGWGENTREQYVKFLLAKGVSA